MEVFFEARPVRAKGEDVEVGILRGVARLALPRIEN